MIKVYGVPGWGSAISEVMLTLAEIPYHFINVDGFDSDGLSGSYLKIESAVPGAHSGTGKWQCDDGNGGDRADDPRSSP